MPAKSTRSPAKSKSKKTTLDLQKNLLKRKGDVVEKYVSSSDVEYFDWGAYQELYEEVDWLPKISHFETVDEGVSKFDIEWIDGVLLDDLYKDPKTDVPHEMRCLHYYQILNMYVVMQNYSKKREKEEIAKMEPDPDFVRTHPIAAARAEWRNRAEWKDKVFFHNDVSTTNVICTPNEELILIDPDAFAWGDRINFVTSIMSRYSRWLFKILENDDK